MEIFKIHNEQNKSKKYPFYSIAWVNSKAKTPFESTTKYLRLKQPLQFLMHNKNLHQIRKCIENLLWWSIGRQNYTKFCIIQKRIQLEFSVILFSLINKKRDLLKQQKKKKNSAQRKHTICKQSVKEHKQTKKCHQNLNIPPVCIFRTYVKKFLFLKINLLKYYFVYFFFFFLFFVFAVVRSNVIEIIIKYLNIFFIISIYKLFSVFFC